MVFPDLRGLGDATYSSGGYDLRTVAQDISELRTQLDHKKFHLAGKIEDQRRVPISSRPSRTSPSQGVDWTHFGKMNMETNRW